MKKLREIMRDGFLIAVPRDATVTEAARAMTEKNVGIVVILENDRPIGVFSERDAVRRVIGKGLDPSTTLVEEVMTSNLLVADENEGYQTAMRMMDQANIRHLPVVRGTQVASMLSIRDLMRVDMKRMDEELRFLQEYLYTTPHDFSSKGQK